LKENKSFKDLAKPTSYYTYIVQILHGSWFERMLYLNEWGGYACSKGKADLLVLAPCLWRALLSSMNSVDGYGNIAKCSNILQDTYYKINRNLGPAARVTLESTLLFVGLGIKA
jgi:hypothetical protein